MSKFTQFVVTLSILASGLTPLQHKANKWFVERNPSICFPRFIPAAGFHERMALWLAHRRKGDIAIATFSSVNDWDACVPYGSEPSATGYAPSSFRYRVFTAFYGEVPAGKQLDHICHDPAVCPGGIECPHRACCNPLHFAVTESHENVARSSNGSPTPRRAGKPAPVRVIGSECANGHLITPSSINPRGDCRPCNADCQARFTAKAKAKKTHPKGRSERSTRP